MTSLLLRGIPTPQSAACDACSLGVMDVENPHLWGECKCSCHIPLEVERCVKADCTNKRTSGFLLCDSCASAGGNV